MTEPTPLAFFNSLTRAVEPFAPIDPAMVRIYSCGPTVYHTAHLGNLRAYVFTDTLRRTLNWHGLAVNHVINITDVGHLTSDADAGDDKMEAAAARAARSIWEVAAFYTDAFKADLARLNILSPTLWSTATDHIQDMIAFARTIEARGYAYRLADGLYFDVTKVPDYGRLAGARAEETVGRIAEVSGKRHPADFALWRTSAPGETRQMEWASPWGPGAPGWHLECSVMSMKYLGTRFDIHTGGIDHREIHHPNEIAQNQAYTCSAETGANWWMHNNFLVAREQDGRGGKMSKSSGGALDLRSVIERGVHPLAYRMLCLSAHYRSELDYSGEALGAALVRLRRLVIAVEALRAEVGDVDWLRVAAEARDSRGAALDYQRGVIEAELSAPSRARLERFGAALAGDLGTPQALPHLEEVAAARTLPAGERLRLIASMDLALGLDLLRLTRADLGIRPAGAVMAEAEVVALYDERLAARARKDFGESDRLRDILIAGGVELMDGAAAGWSWRPMLD